MLKATGIVRPVDQLGRVVLPKSLRRMLGLDPDTDVEIYVDGESIILQKYVPFGKGKGYQSGRAKGNQGNHRGTRLGAGARGWGSGLLQARPLGVGGGR
jgi:AbrB family looped-hinge helix DNA binding protein